MAAKRSKLPWIATVAVLLIGGFVARQVLLQRDQVLPYITDAGLRKLAFLDKQIQTEHGRGGARRTDVEFVVALTAAMVDRGKLTGDGRDFDNALGVLDEAEARIAVRTRTEQGVTQIPELHAARARVMAARHRFIEAAQIAEKALRKYPQESALAAIAGEAAVQIGDLRGGEAYLRRLVNTEPRVPNNLIGLAYWAEIAGDLEQAADLLSRAPEANFPRPMPRLRLAYVLSVQGDIRSKQGKLAEARAYYEAALREEATFAQARAGLADLDQYEGKPDSAETRLRDLIASEWPNAEYQVKLAALREAAGDAAEAKQLRRSAEKYFEWSVDSGFEGYLRPLALLKLAKGDYEAAAEYAERDLALRPNRESKAIYRNIFDQAAAHGDPLGRNALDQYRAVASTTVAAPVQP